MISGFSKDKLVFDNTIPLAQNDNIGAFVRAGDDGTLISHYEPVDDPATLVLQDLTYTAACTDEDAGNSITVAYTAGGTAGSEVVTVLGQAISVQIESGVSTANQIKAAVEASLAASELVNVSVSGVGSNAQVTVAATSLAGGTLKQALDVHPIGSHLNGQFHEDCQHTSGDKGQFVLAVRHDDDNTSLTSHDGDYTPLLTDEKGRLKVSAQVDVSSDSVYPEDSLHVDQDLGNFSLAVRYDSLTTGVSGNGDYDAFKTNDDGALWVAAVGDVADDAVEPGGANNHPVKVGTKSRWGALTPVSTNGDRADLISDKYRRAYVNNGANIAMLVQAATVTSAAAILIASNLSGRRSILIQNLDNQAIFIGHDATVTSANGLRIAAGASFQMDLGEDVSVYAISTSASANVRVVELA